MPQRNVVVELKLHIRRRGKDSKVSLVSQDVDKDAVIYVVTHKTSIKKIINVLKLWYVSQVSDINASPLHEK